MPAAVGSDAAGADDNVARITGRRRSSIRLSSSARLALDLVPRPADGRPARSVPGPPGRRLPRVAVCILCACRSLSSASARPHAHTGVRAHEPGQTGARRCKRARYCRRTELVHGVGQRAGVQLPQPPLLLWRLLLLPPTMTMQRRATRAAESRSGNGRPVGPDAGGARARRCASRPRPPGARRPERSQRRWSDRVGPCRTVSAATSASVCVRVSVTVCDCVCVRACNCTTTMRRPLMAVRFSGAAAVTEGHSDAGQYGGRGWRRWRRRW